MAPYTTPFLGNIPCQLDLDEIESQARLRHAELCKRTGRISEAHAHNLTAQFYESAEGAWLDKFDILFVASELARQELTQRYVDIRFLPNVVHVPAALPAWPSHNLFTLLFVANMGYYPNRDAVEFLVNEIVPNLRQELGTPFRVKLVGSGDLPRNQTESFPPEVSWLGYVSELEEIYEKSHVVVVPIRSGGGTRIKILEAFAHSRPVVTTTLGAEGLPVVPDTHCLIADTPHSFAQACARLHEDESLPGRLCQNAYALVNEKFTQECLENLIDGSGSS
jgi:glycosyltransferase involved in cell wall biosynthesis